MSPAWPRTRPAPDISNSASDNAGVGMQVGIVHGNIRYEVKDGDPPQRKFAVAKHCLAGDMPRRAEELIREVYEEGYVSPDRPCPLANEVAYYWAVAVLSDRTFELLDRERFTDIARTCALAQDGPSDQWHRAHAAVVLLVDHLHEQERTGGRGPDRLDAFFAAFDRLEEVHREEILRHLDLILTGAAQDRMEARFAAEVRAGRTADDRLGRVWKFFEPVPAEPRPLPVRLPDLGLARGSVAVAGAVLTLAGAALYLYLIKVLSGRFEWIAPLCVLLGAPAIGWALPSFLHGRYGSFAPQNPGATSPRAEARVREAVQREFDRRAPEAPLQRSAWTVTTMRHRTALAEEICALYDDAQIEAGGVDWLIAWHAEQAERTWAANGYRDRTRILRWAALILGALLCLYGCIRLLEQTMWMGASGTGTRIAILWFLGGVLLVVASKADAHLVLLARRGPDRARARRRHQEEEAAYRARRERLTDRPDDAEMARWLDYDKIFLKTLAMNQYGLGHRDVIAHAFLTEAAPNCRRARFRNGPPRFSAYNVWVFLLTERGVRQMAVHLDFPTGIAKDLKRAAFSYDAVTSARVEETGLRFDDGHRATLLPGRDDAGDRPDDTSSLIVYQVFSLTLDNGQRFQITVENLDEWIIEQLLDGKGMSAAWNPDTVDLTGALRMLEAVAADGREWIARARERRRGERAGHGARAGNGNGEVGREMPRL